MLVNFDWDGVLVDSIGHLTRYFLQAHQMTKLGREMTRNDLRFIPNLTMEDCAKLVGVEESYIDEFRRAFISAQGSSVETPKFFPGVTDAIRCIRKKSKIVIITSNFREEVEKSLSREGISDCIELIFDGNDKGSKSDKIISAMQILSESKEATFMVGDSRSDISHGKSAEVNTIGVTWGYQPEYVRSENPTFLVDSIYELVGVICQFSR